jgi:hypothetical protein
MLVIQDQQFQGRVDRNSKRIFGDLELRRCSFTGCTFALADEPSLRSEVRNVRLIRCHARSSLAMGIIANDVLVDGLKTAANPPLFCCGCAFRHVVFKNNIDVVMLTNDLPDAEPRRAKAFADANRAFYADVDWAIDISEARFKECDIRGIPASLIRRDPTTQAVVKRENAAGIVWSWEQTSGWTKVRCRGMTLDLSKTWWPISMEVMLQMGYSDRVLVAPKRSPKFQDALEGIRMLREAGVAELE